MWALSWLPGGNEGLVSEGQQCACRVGLLSGWLCKPGRASIRESLETTPQPTQLVFRKAYVPRGCWWWQAVVLEAKSVGCPWRSSLFVETGAGWEAGRLGAG